MAPARKPSSHDPEQLAVDLGLSSSLLPWLAHAPYRPYCSDDLSAGLRIRSLKQAIACRYMQHNAPAQVWTIVMDVDRRVCDPESLSYCWEEKGTDGPVPNAMAINRENGHGHLYYFLAAGVTRTQAGRDAPLRFLAAVEHGLCDKLGADPRYVGLVSKNPAHADWLVHEFHDQLWTLGELADYLDLNPANASRYVPATPEEAFQDGRNVYLFHTARPWSYRAIRDYWAPDGLSRWQEAVIGHVGSLNVQFPEPLGISEVRAIAKSIARWTWRHLTPTSWQKYVEKTHNSESQARRGRKATNQAEAGRHAANQTEAGRLGGLATTNQLDISALGGKASGQARRMISEQDRATARLLHARGYTQAQIVAEMAVPKQTISRWLAGR